MKFTTGILLVCALCAPTLCRAELLAHGTADTYWIAQVRPDQAGGFRTIIRERSVGGSPDWRVIAQINSRVLSMASQGTQLAVLLENDKGETDWMMVWDGGSSTTALPEDGSRLRALAGSNDTIWAIAQAMSGRQPTTRGATQPATTMPVGTLLLYRLEQGRWTMIAALPPRAATSTNISLAVFERPTLALLEENGRIETFDFDINSRAWRDMGSITAPASVNQIKLLTGLQRPFLWAGDDHSGGMIYPHNDSWGSDIGLSIPAAELGEGVEDVAIAGKSVRVLAQGPGKIIEHSFSPDGSGRQRVDLPNVLAPEGPGQTEWFTAAAMGMLLYVLLSTFRQRVPADLTKLQEHNLMLGSLARRLISGLLDALPLLISGAVVVARVPAGRITDLQFIMEFMFEAFQHPMMIIASAVYIGHTLICELIWGWSLGKKICGLRVVMLDGSVPPKRSIVLRNALRLIDLALLPLMLVLVSPLRQRVGDVAAETVVVMNSKKS